MKFLLERLCKMTPKECSPRAFPTLEISDTFVEVTPAQKQYYDNDVVKAINNRDIAALRAWHRQGRPLHTANPFGETLLHMACRRGFFDVVRFLVDEAEVSIWVRDEQGSTPLHLACRATTTTTSETLYTAFALVNFLINKDNDMLFCADMRGHAPLEHAPKDQWEDWIKFLRTKSIHSLMPQRLIFFTKPPKKSSKEEKTQKKKTSSKQQQQQQQSQQQTEEPSILENIEFIIADYYDSKKRPKAPKPKKQKSKRKIQRELYVLCVFLVGSSCIYIHILTHSNAYIQQQQQLWQHL